MTRILVSDSLSSEGLTILKNSGFEVVHKPDISAEDLKNEIADYDALVIRSRTTVTADIINNAPKLRVVGRAGVGLDNVDVQAATKNGVIVMNTPGGNTISTAEHTWALLISLARSIPQADRSMKEGRWDKKKYTGVELFNKTLGILGLGRIGSEVARRALAFGMQVIAYDPYTSTDAMKRIGVTQATVEEICKAADFITVHSPLNESTRNLIGAAQIETMKKSVRIINCARGGIINEQALLEALQNGRVAGAALDVFEAEPLPKDHPFRSLENVVLTPHLGAATTEAQEGVAREVAEQIVDALSGRIIRNAINAPSVDPVILEQIRPYVDLTRRMGKFMAQFVPEAATSLRVYYSGDVLQYPIASITTAALVGYLEAVTDFSVNFVNAKVLAADRGIELVELTSTKVYSFANLITVEVVTEDGAKHWIGGTLFTKDNPRIVVVNDKFFDVVPEGNLIVIENRDVPGIIGSVGTLLGDHKINIAQMTWGRTSPGHDAITVINVDQEVKREVLDEIAKLPNILSARLIRI
jgi:D-3-phosphoglycerate dehydrogenase / 2-oxoglutarate reductase